MAMNVEVPPRLRSLIEEKIETGGYADASQVVAAALELWRAADQQASFRAAVQLGMDELARGEGIVWTPELHDEIIANARRRAARGERPSADVLPLQ